MKMRLTGSKQAVESLRNVPVAAGQLAASQLTAQLAKPSANSTRPTAAVIFHFGQPHPKPVKSSMTDTFNFNPHPSPSPSGRRGQRQLFKSSP